MRERLVCCLLKETTSNLAVSFQEGLIAYAAAQPDRNDQINGQWWGSRLLVGLGGALGVALTAGLILKL